MKSIYVLGDSISIHYGPFLKMFTAGRYDYARKSAADVAAAGLESEQGENGGDSSAVLKFLERMFGRKRLTANLLLLNCGLHDIRTAPDTGQIQVSFEDYQSNIKRIIALCAEHGQEVVWVTTTPCDDDVHNAGEMSFHRFDADRKRYSEAAEEIIGAAGIPAIDLYSFTKALGDDLYCDHVHFNDHIREKQGAFIAGWLIGYAEETGRRD